MSPSLARQLGETFKNDNITSLVARHVMASTDFGDDRRSDCVHPSEAAHANWCPRQTFYRIAGYPSSFVAPPAFLFEMVFERGHDSHRKWQDWLRQMGILRGLWRCLNCDRQWWATSPTFCSCGSSGRQIVYAEVPLENPEHLLAGHADGDVLLEERTLIEVKTIGTGTIRIEAPKLMERYTYSHTDDFGKVHTDVDWRALWFGIRQPFASHLRQGMLYCFMAQRKKIVFIYDPKFLTAPPKEFEVEFRLDVIEDTLAKCLQIKAALEKNVPPKRPIWADPKHPHCKECPFKDVCYANRRNPGDLSATGGRKGRA